MNYSGCRLFSVHILVPHRLRNRSIESVENVAIILTGRDWEEGEINISLARTARRATKLAGGLSWQKCRPNALFYLLYALRIINTDIYHKIPEGIITTNGALHCTCGPWRIFTYLFRSKRKFHLFVHMALACPRGDKTQLLYHFFFSVVLINHADEPWEFCFCKCKKNIFIEMKHVIKLNS